MEYLLISDNLVTLFKFWADGKIQDGMRHGNELFRQVSVFQTKQRQQAFDLAWSLSQEALPLVITASPYNYTVWVSLRSPESVAQEPCSTDNQPVAYSGKRTVLNQY